MMNREQKTEWANAFREKAQKAKVALFADYKGLTATQADILRKQLRDSKSEAKVVKNNLARKAAADGKMGDEVKSLMDELAGPVMVAFSYEDPAATAKILKEFSKENEAFVLRDSLMGDKRIAAADVEALASLPSKEVLLGMLLSTFNGPARGFVSVMAAVPRSFVGVLAALERKKKEAGEA